MQWVQYSEKDYDCYIIGRYDPAHDDLYYQLLDKNDPSKGISMRYPDGDKCVIDEPDGEHDSRLRSATIDVQCANVAVNVLSAQEPEECEYHMVVESYHGCPTVSYTH